MARVTSQRTRQAILAPEAELAADIVPEYIALFDEEGNPIALSAAAGVPPLGDPDQVLTKNTDDSYDMEWRDVPPGIPAGGTDGQVLTKQSATDHDANWESIVVPPAFQVYRKAAAASVVVPAGTNVVDITLTIVLAGTRLVHFLGRAGHSDPPSSHSFDWAINGASILSGGNNSSGVTHYGIINGVNGPAAASFATGAAELGDGFYRVLAAGTHTFTHRTTRGSAGGTMQDRVLIATVFDTAVTDQ